MFALLHAAGVLPLGVLQRFDDIIYDARLRATMPKSMDERIVIVDVDEKSLASVGRWPWGRNKLADLVNKLFAEHKIAILGVDVVFAEPDESSGLQHLKELAKNELNDQPVFLARLQELTPRLDYDGVFARTLESRPIVLGYFFTNDPQGRSSGVLPPPVFLEEALLGRTLDAPEWTAFGSNIAGLADAAPMAGHFNSFTDPDGVVRSVPLVAHYKDAYYESLSLAMFRAIVGMPKIAPSYSKETFLPKAFQGVDKLLLTQGDKTLGIPVDRRGGALIPFRGPGNAQGGSFQYVSAADVLENRVPVGKLKDKIVLLGTTALGLFDMRVTPVGEAYPGVETHANMLSALLDGHVLVKPDYAMGFELVVLVFSGLVLAIGLPLLSAMRAVVLSTSVLACLLVLNLWLYLGYGLVFPLAGALAMTATAFALNMSYGYFVESRSKRDLANLFGTYVPPELVDEMVQDPDSYNMKATSRHMTVMFCDMRGFTNMSEAMEPVQLQAMLTGVFSRLTSVIRAHRGTIDKYMGDCVMAFWGAPVESSDHAQLAIKASLEIVEVIGEINKEHHQAGLPQIGIGIGINTGFMCVGDMGSDIRRSYTVIGDAVNLASRLESLSKIYGVDIVASEGTRQATTDILWQELDKVRVKGKEQAVKIWTPLALNVRTTSSLSDEVKLWSQFLKMYRSQQWDQADVALLNVSRMNPERFLYSLYSQRVASMRHLPFDSEWDGATNFETK
ncbi:CHASE2 domain-containing protein [Rhodoferax mekongensis]|uniref:CHASE2 domain-containing protein n=1 Tax=Rhodoferax mekongensis TaxID=3068341 RepID=UPI0028BE2FEC|nr:adenylate/guanylate cyclase domain-containing protein [Rhodoferax sp. TBRC 17199]MDT7513583.1 adenylate/guanylate cyclase domain-containing protein [Rhodoferax sp. TBRC 17199]